MIKETKQNKNVAFILIAVFLALALFAQQIMIEQRINSDLQEIIKQEVNQELTSLIGEYDIVIYE